MPSSLALRDELETMVLKELLGPAGGPDEEIIESPGTRYFVGVLAPRKRATSGAPPVATGRPSPTSLDAEDEEADDEILDGDELALGGRDTGQDGTTDRAPAQDKALIPSSFGMTFCVNLEATELRGHGGVGPVRPGEQRIPGQREDRHSPARLEALATWRHALSMPTRRRAIGPDRRRSRVPGRRRPGAHPQTRDDTGASRCSWSTSSRSRRG